MKADAEERIRKIKIKLVNGNPFFAYLSLYLQIEEDKHGVVPKNCGMSVSPTGRVWYRKEFVDEISDKELLGVIKHEILHLALLHLTRVGKRNHTKWNVATDVAVNTILLTKDDEGKCDELPKGLKPNSANQFIIMGKVIKDINKKSAEEIYDELPEIPEQNIKIYITFDEHEFNKLLKDGDAVELTEADLQKLENEWFNQVQTAIVLAQQRGQLPAGMERYVDRLKEVEINWRVVLLRFIQQLIPRDYDWSHRSKKGYALNVYLPSVTKEKIKIVVGIDTSGSIGQEELTKFLSEIIGIARTFRENIDMRIMFHDVEVQADYLVKNGSIPQIMAMKIRGGGGTSHRPLFDKVKKEIRDCECLISFTDGFSDIENIDMSKYPFAKFFIINKDGMIPKIRKNEAIIIKLRGV